MARCGDDATGIGGRRRDEAGRDKVAVANGSCVDILTVHLDAIIQTTPIFIQNLGIIFHCKVEN